MRKRPPRTLSGKWRSRRFMATAILIPMKGGKNRNLRAMIAASMAYREYNVATMMPMMDSTTKDPG